MHKTIRGVLLDVYPTSEAMVLWVRAGGDVIRLQDNVPLPLYLGGSASARNRAIRRLDSRGLIARSRYTRMTEFWSGEQVVVAEVICRGYGRRKEIASALLPLEGPLEIYNCDIPEDQYYLYVRNLFPFADIEAEVENSAVLSIAATTSPWETEYDPPDLPWLDLTLEGDRGRGVHAGALRLRTWEGYEMELSTRSSADAVQAVADAITRSDPDLVLTDRGDSVLLPELQRAARRSRVSLGLDREPAPQALRRGGRGSSYFSYGRILYKDGSFDLMGRIHIDRSNSFIYKQCGLEGVVEFARISKLPVQRAARASPGTAISSMQVEQAVRDRILVPHRKSRAENFKTAAQLLSGDKGGLIFMPPPGLHVGVAEIDFESMYPGLMARHNISPETVACACCTGADVPELRYHICKRRRGLVPRVLEPLLKRRSRYKTQAAHTTGTARETYDNRQAVLKWMLVTCFGYLGYKNARFGRIESHEAVTAFGREALLTAKEICEARGYEVLHAMTDSLWIRPRRRDAEGLQSLCALITDATGVRMSLEARYKWVAFLPSRVDLARPVPNRFFGAIEGGGLKARGVASRRGDMPEFIRGAQRELLELLSLARNPKEFRRKAAGEAAQLAADFEFALTSGEVDPDSLLIRRRMSKETSDYSNETLAHVAALQLEKAGKHVRPGEKVQYLICHEAAHIPEERARPYELLSADDGYDAQKYLDMLEQAVKEVLGMNDKY